VGFPSSNRHQPEFFSIGLGFGDTFPSAPICSTPRLKVHLRLHLGALHINPTPPLFLFPLAVRMTISLGSPSFYAPLPPVGLLLLAPTTFFSPSCSLTVRSNQPLTCLPPFLFFCVYDLATPFPFFSFQPPSESPFISSPFS